MIAVADWAYVTGALAAATAVVGGSWVAARHGGDRVARTVGEQLHTGNGHSAGQSLANLETKVGGIQIMQAEQVVAMQGIDRRLSRQAELLSEHLIEVGPLIVQFKAMRDKLEDP